MAKTKVKPTYPAKAPLPRPSDKHILALYRAIEHGNEEHRQWLKEALFAWFHNEEIPKVKGLDNV